MKPEVLENTLCITGAFENEYHAVFDSKNPNFSPMAKYNVAFLHNCALYISEKIESNGIVFLNEALSALELPRCLIGQIIGWRKDGICRDCKPFMTNIANDGQPISLTFMLDGPVIQLLSKE